MITLTLNDTDTLLIPAGAGERKRNIRKGAHVAVIKKQEELRALDFPAGWEHYEDLRCMLGSDRHAENICRLVVDYCEFDQKRYIASVERIAALPSTNPNKVENVEETILRMGMEFYLLAYRHRLFSPTQGFAYDFYRFAESRIILQRKKMM